MTPDKPHRCDECGYETTELVHTDRAAIEVPSPRGMTRIPGPGWHCQDRRACKERRYGGW